MASSRCILKRLNLFGVAFACYLIGILTYDHLPLPIPLVHEIRRDWMLEIVTTAAICFFAGGWVFEHVRIVRSRTSDAANLASPRPQQQFLICMILAYAMAIVGMFLFAGRGIPMLATHAEQASAIKTSLNVRAYGLTRATDVALPFAAIYSIGLAMKYARRRHVRIAAVVIYLIPLVFMFLKAAKGNILVFLFGILVIYDAVHPGRIRIFSAKVLGILGVGFMIAVGAFYVTEGTGVAYSAQYLVARALVYSWEAFNYIVTANLPPDLKDQLIRFVSIGAVKDSPDLLLARDFFATQSTTFGVVPTLFGFLYRNGGIALVAAGLFAMGLVVRGVLLRMERNRDDLLKVTGLFFAYVMLLRILLVGNVFDELRGFGLTTLVVYTFFSLTRRVTWSRSPVTTSPLESRPTS